MYTGGIPAIEEVRFSITHNRGCFGGCNFCALAFHQGRMVTSRSIQSVLEEAELLTHDPEFKGYIHDVGGPSANFRHTSCQKQKRCGMCKTAAASPRALSQPGRGPLGVHGAAAKNAADTRHQKGIRPLRHPL